MCVAPMLDARLLFFFFFSFHLFSSPFEFLSEEEREDEIQGVGRKRGKEY